MIGGARHLPLQGGPVPPEQPGVRGESESESTERETSDRDRDRERERGEREREGGREGGREGEREGMVGVNGRTLTP
jgi:hypothetical protein